MISLQLHHLLQRETHYHQQLQLNLPMSAEDQQEGTVEDSLNLKKANLKRIWMFLLRTLRTKKRSQ